jgi:hypothetical protein
MRSILMRMAASILGVVLIIVTAIDGARAAVVYTYTGPVFSTIGPDDVTIPGTYNSSMSISGSFTVAMALTASPGLVDISGILLDFSFSEGRNPPLTLATTGNLIDFEVRADGGGNIIEWNILMQPQPATSLAADEIGYTIQSLTSGDFAATFRCVIAIANCTTFVSEFASVNQAGSWGQTSISEVPLPATLPLMAGGISLLGFLGWRRRRLFVRPHNKRCQ